MFSLIIVLISVALVAALALATLYYGGSTFAEGQDSAVASKLFNESTQIRAAAELHHVQTGAYAPDIATLVSANYLKAVPAGGSWSAYQDTVAVSGVAQKACETLNERHGITGIPQCSAVASDVDSVCCEMP